MPFSPVLLLAHRRRIGISAETLARRIDRSVSTIRKYERGVIEPSATALGRMAAALDITVGELFDADLTGVHRAS